jgi:hypothetical protein
MQSIIKYPIPLSAIKEIIDFPLRTSLPQLINDFREELSSISFIDQHFEMLKQNTKFCLLLSKSMLEIQKNEAVFAFFHHFINVYIDNNFDKNVISNWLKFTSILFFANYFKSVKTIREFEQKIKRDSFHLALNKYKRNDLMVI